MANNYLKSVISQFEYYKQLADKTFAQLSDEALQWQYNAESNSIAIIVKHLSGNMLSRWTDFLQADGEKPWRDRDAEFDKGYASKEEMFEAWEKGWNVCLTALRSLTDADLQKTVYIRNQGHTVLEAINRQLAHYPYHIGQIVFIGKMLASEWKSLSIPRNKSADYNRDKFSKEKHKEHFTDEFLPPEKE
jgi:hypothetical protein